ncbi:MAG: fused MFS/spermidine synthase [Bacteriovoracaceae bacterium]|nr:fused MFS/spermidine synthase [Bacteriovoracaceae bacterium]
MSLATSAFLAGIALSSLIFSKYISRENVRIFIGFTQLAVAIYAFFFLKHYDFIPALLDSENLLKHLFLWFYILIPALLLGGSFPLLNGLYLNSLPDSIKQTGLIYFVDTIGAVTGAILAGIYFIPSFGLGMTLNIAISINLLLAFFVFSKKWQKFIVIIFSTFFLLFLIYNKNELIKYSPRFGSILFQKQSDFGVVTVGKNNDIDFLFIDYRIMCSSADNDSTGHIIMAKEALKYAPSNATVLNIGLGCGMTAATLMAASKVKHLDIIEINPVVVSATENYFNQYNQNLLKNPKVSLIIENGSEVIRTTSKKYDTIIIDIEEVDIITSSALYTYEYFLIASKLLKPKGLFTFWSASISDKFNGILLNTLKKAFKYTAYQTFPNEIVLYGSNDQLINPSYYPSQSQVDIMQNSDEINTLDNKILIKYFDSKEAFQINEN